MLSAIFSSNQQRVNTSSIRNEESNKFTLRQVQSVNDLSVDTSGELMALGRLPNPNNITPTGSSTNTSSTLSSSLNSTSSHISSATNISSTSSQPSLLLHKSKKNEVSCVQFSHDIAKPILAYTTSDSLQILDLSKGVTSSTIPNSSISSIAGGSSGVRGRTSSNTSTIGSITSFTSNDTDRDRSFQAHQRSINSISWSPHDLTNSKIATCSGDGFVNIWDTRLPSNQCKVASFISYTDFPSIVCWNPIDSNIIASAHNVDLRIWDIRNCSSSSTPSNKFTTFISAHHPLISSMDWSPTNAHEIVTAGSMDKLVKIWDYTEQKLIMTQRVAFPVSKIRYTPFGKGLVSISKKEHQVRVWKLNYPSQKASNRPMGSPSNPTTGIEPIENISLFSGHTDEIRCLDFRVTDNIGNQLLTWSKDMSIRFWNFSPQLIDDLKSTEMMTSPSNSKENLSGSLDKGFLLSRSPIGMMSNHLLGNEWSITSIPDHIFETDPSALFAGLGDQPSSNNGGMGSPVVSLSFDSEVEKLESILNNLKFCTRVKTGATEKPENNECELKLNIEKIDKREQARSCILNIILIIKSVSVPNTPPTINELKLKITFPKLYPVGAPPSFEFIQSRSFISVNDLKIIKQALTSAAHEDVLKHRNCMLSCLRAIISILGKTRWRERKENEQDGVAIIGGQSSTFNSPTSVGMPKVLSSINLATMSSSNTVEDQPQSQDTKNNVDSVNDNVAQVLKKTTVDEGSFIAHPISGARFSPSGDLIYFNSFSLRSMKKPKESIESKQKSEKKKNDSDFGYRYYVDMVNDLKTPFEMTIRNRNKDFNEDHNDKRKKKQKKEKKEASKVSSNMSAETQTNSLDTSSKQYVTDITDELTPNNMKEIDELSNKEQDNNYFSSVYNEYHDESSEDDTYYSEYEDEYGEDVNQYYGNHNGYIGEIYEHGEDQHYIANEQKQRFISFNDTRTDPRIHIYDSKYLLPVSYSLAQQYRVVGINAVEVCRENSKICLMEGRKDLSKMWVILSQIIEPRLYYETKNNVAKPSPVWTHHALGRRFVKKILTHFLSKHDIQTCAVISCVLQQALKDISLEISNFNLRNTESDDLALEFNPKHKPHEFIPINQDVSLNRKLEVYESCDLIEKEMRPIMSHVRQCYAKLLQSWGLHLQRCEIMKYNVSTQTTQRFMNGTSECSIDIESVPILNEQYRRNLSLQQHQQQLPKKYIHCSLCRSPVRGVVSYCPNCNHGGHVEHLQNWFQNHSTCPAGCDCKCSEFMTFYPVLPPHTAQKILTVTTNNNHFSPNNFSSLLKPTTQRNSASTPNMQSNQSPFLKNETIGASLLSFLN
ncbi:predicted protein [Naegleria gruberi]|uniref:Predicted protein n=1 Tax=Naegleria gruberi TaxID=5762 RepID=D2VX89_NAEGR|nr:uncharacterized protein NAEGRDRAFT_73659 [Naegleria gruberi]EFC38635.1 predicted protein [Naegleria gruberi]|eukprot:XP_002671379.1 predicted protein [Naegleria gruberi strain NEG-M]